MRICIDARMMGPTNTRGIGRFIEEIVRAMLKVAPDQRLILITRTKDHPFVTHPEIDTVIADIPWYGWAEQIRMPWVFRSVKADIVFVPHWNVPLFFMPNRFVVFVHDLLLFHVHTSAKTSLRHPVIAWVKRIAHRVVVRRALKKAEDVLVPTNFVREDIGDFFPLILGKTKVVGEGMPIVRVSPQQVAPYQGNPKFLLYVGSAYPHKGLDEALEAWKMAEKEFSELEFWVVGERDAFMAQFENKVKQSGVQRLRFLGRISDQELEKLYAQALGLLYPSHFEGFGLPPLEAIAYGCPVLSSDAPALPEVLGEEGIIFFRTGSADAILHAIRKLIADPDGARQRTAKIALKLAERHKWEEAARHVLEALRNA